MDTIEAPAKPKVSAIRRRYQAAVEAPSNDMVVRISEMIARGTGELVGTHLMFHHQVKGMLWAAQEIVDEDNGRGEGQ